ncbi:MAG TPA: hypothetical protein VHP33_18035, partial [Polyangiaceae bacterium]|nr:hypothetical protein [Polyangiaceae bacterium]
LPPIESVRRVDGAYSKVSVEWDCLDEMLTFTHSATSPKAYVAGSLLAAQVLTRCGGVHLGLDELLRETRYSVPVAASGRN